MRETQKDKDELPEAEIERRRDEVLKRMLKSPPKPHKDVAPKRPKPQRKRPARNKSQSERGEP